MNSARRYERKGRSNPWSKLEKLSTEQLVDALINKTWRELHEAQEVVRRCRRTLLEWGGVSGRRGSKSLKALVIQALSEGDRSRTEIFDRVLDLGYKPRGMKRETLLGRISALLAGDLADLVGPVGHGVLGMTGVRWRLVEGGAKKYRRRVTQRRRKLVEARIDTKRQKEETRASESQRRHTRRPKKKHSKRIPGEGVLRFNGAPRARNGSLLPPGEKRVATA